ncbi:PAC2 family protein [Brevibacterium sp. 91QC2O2]|jgi:hypothetical protein|uniref:PAC2 family protein n=1 Tax=Brevibacterium sp. 91QC2O2 TaxID=2968458 RepID=UPI00211C26AD|nr:PAC2 family protein [Brevibacterium sp. 91QC2O2]MCQ9366792.1 PAC2 family protein [Brevibacterium sp. 91QC2O2]
MSYLSAGQRLVVIALEGWTDAANAASDLARHLIEQWNLSPGPELAGEEFYDLTCARPLIERTPAGPVIRMPSLQCFDGTVPGGGNPIRVVLGPEPQLHWSRFATEFLDLVSTGDRVVSLGALAAEVPHTRPLPVTLTSEDPAAHGEAVVAEEYEGPTGFMGFVQPLLAASGCEPVNAWVLAPDYALAAPNPKALLALLGVFEDLTGLLVDHREIHVEAEAWLAGVDALVADDADLAGLVEELESQVDAADLPEATGEAIAREIERYLRRRE